MFQSSEFDSFFNLSDEEFLSEPFVATVVNDQKNVQKESRVVSIQEDIEKLSQNKSSKEPREFQEHDCDDKSGKDTCDGTDRNIFITAKKISCNTTSSCDNNKLSQIYKSTFSADKQTNVDSYRKQCVNTDICKSSITSNKPELSEITSNTSDFKAKESNICKIPSFELSLDLDILDDFPLDFETKKSKENGEMVVAKKLRIENGNNINSKSHLTCQLDDCDNVDQPLSLNSFVTAACMEQLMKNDSTRLTKSAAEAKQKYAKIQQCEGEVGNPVPGVNNSVDINICHSLSPSQSIVQEQTSKFTSVTAMCRHSDLRMRKRRFPGPAGLLPHIPLGSPELMSKSLRSCSPTSLNPAKPVIPDEIPNSQTSELEFSKMPWLQMMQEFRNDDSGDSRFTIDWTIKKARSKQLPRGKVPVLYVLVKSILVKRNEGTAVFKDKTGEIVGSIHRKLLEEYPNKICQGTAMVLKQVSILSLGTRKHYLNLTTHNVVCMYFYNESLDQVDRIMVNSCTPSELQLLIKEAEAEMKNKLHSSPESSHPQCPSSSNSNDLHAPHGSLLFNSVSQHCSPKTSASSQGLSLTGKKQSSVIDVGKASAKQNVIKPTQVSSLATAAERLEKFRMVSVPHAQSHNSVNPLNSSRQHGVNALSKSSDTCVSVAGLNSKGGVSMDKASNEIDYKWEEDGFEELLQSMDDSVIFDMN